MATAGFKTRVLIGDASFSAKLSDISLPHTVDMLDTTTFGDDGVKRFIPGVSGGEVSMSGFIDADAQTDIAAWTSTTPITYGQFGLARGSRVNLVDTLRGNFEVGSSVAGVSSFDVAATVDGYTDFGVSLHDIEAETSDTDETSHDNSASTSNGGVGQLHVTAFSGLTQAVLKVQHSSNNSDWTDLVTFTTVTGTTSQRSAVTGTVNRYLRASLDVTGTGSITYQMSFARR